MPTGKSEIRSSCREVASTKKLLNSNKQNSSFIVQAAKTIKVYDFIYTNGLQFQIYLIAFCSFIAVLCREVDLVELDMQASSLKVFNVKLISKNIRKQSQAD